MIKVNNKEVVINNFYDGTLHISLDNKGVENHIEWVYENEAEVSAFLMIASELKEHGKVIASIPYFPNARMDRVEDSSTLFTLKHFINIINSLNIDEVHVLDPHSNYIGEHLRNAVIHYSDKYVKSIIDKDTVILFPDKGAYNRYKSLYSDYKCTYADKKRNWSTGKIEDYYISGDTSEIANSKVMIVDDICSRGGTFKLAAECLRSVGVKHIDLFVSHLENNVVNGVLLNDDFILNKLYTLDTISISLKGEYSKLVIIKR